MYEYKELITDKSYKGAKLQLVKRLKNLRDDFSGYKIVEKRVLGLNNGKKAFLFKVKLNKRR